MMPWYGMIGMMGVVGGGTHGIGIALALEYPPQQNTRESKQRLKANAKKTAHKTVEGGGTRTSTHKINANAFPPTMIDR